MFKKLLYTLDRKFDWKRSSHESTDQAKAINTGDVVECAIENTSDILYRVESINHAANEARVRRLDTNGRDTSEAYTLAPVMLRPLKSPVKR